MVSHSLSIDLSFNLFGRQSLESREGEMASENECRKEEEGEEENLFFSSVALLPSFLAKYGVRYNSFTAGWKLRPFYGTNRD